jgi:hypothetical protein
VCDSDAVLVRETLTEGIEGARPYITEDDTEGDESKNRVLAGRRSQFLMFSIYPGTASQRKPRIYDTTKAGNG